MSDATPSPARLVAAMMRPDFYPERPKEVELLQTHISYVFIAGDFVYKLKKAVRFSFIDCTDLGQRRHLCDEEIRLNRRLAHDVYLGRYPIFRRGSDFVLGDAPGEHHGAIEYVIKMRRLPAECMLDRILARHEVGRAGIDALAAVIVSFHREYFFRSRRQIRIGIRAMASRRRRTERPRTARGFDIDGKSIADHRKLLPRVPDLALENAQRAGASRPPARGTWRPAL